MSKKSAGRSIIRSYDLGITAMRMASNAIGDLELTGPPTDYNHMHIYLHLNN